MSRLSVLIILIIIVSFSEGFSQITFENPSFEGIPPPCVFCNPIGWIQGDYPPDIVPDTSGITCMLPVDGICYVGIVGAGDLNNGFPPGGRYMQQQLSCALKKGKEHSFTLYLTRDSVADAIYGYPAGRVKIMAGTDSSTEEQLLWESPLLENHWQLYTATFTPNEPYDWISIKPENIWMHTTADAVDLLSAITIANFKEVHIAVHDTTIDTSACVTLAATATAGYDTALWYKNNLVFATGIGPFSDCPDSNTVYVVATRDTGCGNFWSYDTLRVNIKQQDTTQHGGGGGGLPPIVIPNFLTTENPVWQIINPRSSMSVTVYNTLGQLVYRRSEYKNNLTINELAAATYFYEVKYGSNTYRGKLMVIR